MEGHLEKAVKNARLNRVIKLQNQITCEINDAQIGQVFEVLVESVSQKNQLRVTGLTRQHKTVNFPGDESILGKLALVRVTEGHLYGFVGKGVI
jgi:tRNA-2-methylthio-N6-dimethylallyladenosine synthase